ncbi:cell division protein SepF [Myxacorys almedinensis A]|uniref:Cell division protein SepF n=2 Tax=Myxacorys TaxID=2056239 RepID=A0A8J7Z7E0_9CYAN|nr:cell division protein SepF [Myxacorys almedinensis]NDJ19486.1 cell division protein SepF [Myxacorys almedinensis A]
MDYEYEYDEMDGQDYQTLYQDETPVSAPVPAMEDETRARRATNRFRDSEASLRGNRAAVMGSETTGVVGTTMNNVIGMPGATNGISEVVVMEPRTFEEMPQAIQALRERKSVVLNLTIMDPDQAQRAVDFVAGGTYAIDGHQERIGESIFLFTPSCVQVSTSGNVIHEVPQPQPARPRTNAPTPAWAEPRTAQG